MKVHELKILPEYFSDWMRGRKTAEIRYDDRDYMVGDELILKEWKPRKKVFTGRKINVRVVGMSRLSQLMYLEEADQWDWVVLYCVQMVKVRPVA